MPLVSLPARMGDGGLARPIVKGLFVATCLLSVVSYYTTQQGMALYLSAWFSILAALGIQVSLVLVAWLIGFTRTRQPLLIAVYVITAIVSVAFSYVSLYTWFAAKERPATIQRRLYDVLGDAATKTEGVLTSAVSEQQKHVLALEELTQAEKTHGYIARAKDADPYLAGVREAVAREGQTYADNYREGAGTGVRYTAFDRYTRIAQQQLERMQNAERMLADFRGRLKPLDPTEQQLREFHKMYDGVPWTDVEAALHAPSFQRPEPPAYGEFVDKSVSGQEDLMIAFQELFAAPTNRHVFALALAAFIDIVVFLVAYASGPYFFGSAQQRWVAASAAMDALDDQVFVRNFLSKLVPHPRGMACAEAGALSTGEQQFCILLASRRLATPLEYDGRLYYLIDHGMHEHLLDTLAAPGLPLHASRMGTA